MSVQYRTTTSALRTPDQKLAIEVAMAIFRRIKVAPLALFYDDSVRSLVAAQVAAYPNSNTVARVAGAYPVLPLRLEGEYANCRTWIEKIATEVILQIMLEIVGSDPVYEFRLDETQWVYLGRTLTSQPKVEDPVTDGPIVNNDELVDLWCSTDGLVFVGVSVHGLAVTASRACGPNYTNSYAREGFRRFDLREQALA